MNQKHFPAFPDEAASDNQELTITITENPEKIILGYGRCKSCGCKGWRPNYPKNDYCKDCGHHWTQHE